MNLQELNPSMVMTFPFSRFQSNRPLPQLASHFAAREKIIADNCSEQLHVWKDQESPVFVRKLSVGEISVQGKLVEDDVARFSSKLSSLLTTCHVSAAEIDAARFHLYVATNNLLTADWRGPACVRYCVLRETTRHTALVSLVAENRVSLLNTNVTYLVDEGEQPLPSLDVLNSIAHLTASERIRPMNTSDAVRSVRRFAIAIDKEVQLGSQDRITTAGALKNAFTAALVNASTKSAFSKTCDMQSACVVIMYTKDEVSGSAADELLAWAEHMCPNVDKVLHAVHKCSSTCSFFCSVGALHIVLYRTRDLVSDGVGKCHIFNVLRILERRLISGDLMRPKRTDTVGEPHPIAIRALSNLISELYEALLREVGPALQFGTMATYLGMNLVLETAAPIVGSVSSAVLKPNVMMWTLRRYGSGVNPREIDRLISCYDGLGSEESLLGIVCKGTLRNEVLRVRERRVEIESRTLQAANQNLCSVMHHFTELEPDHSTWDRIRLDWKAMAKKAISNFKEAHRRMEGKCGRIYGVLSAEDAKRVRFCEERVHDFSRHHPRPEAPPIFPEAGGKKPIDDGDRSLTQPASSRKVRQTKNGKRQKKTRPREEKKPSTKPIGESVSKRTRVGNERTEVTATDTELFDTEEGIELDNTDTTAGVHSSNSARHAANTAMSSAVAGLVISFGNRNPVRGAVWNSETGAEPDEIEKRSQFNDRLGKLPSCISRTTYGEIHGNVAPYVMDSTKLEEVGEHARRVFLDPRNCRKTTCRWLSAPADAAVRIDLRRDFVFLGEAARRAELYGSGATIFEEACLPRSADGTVILGGKPYYADFVPAVNMKVNSATGKQVWESIINAPSDGSCEHGTRFGRAMTLPDAINRLGEANGCRTGRNPKHGAYVSKGVGDCMLAAVISRLSADDKVGNPSSSLLEMSAWGSKMLASISPGLKIASGPKCKCNMHLGCPAQRQHVDLPLVSAGTESLQPGTCGDDSDVGLFAIVTGEHGATIRIIKGGMNFMNAADRTFDAATKDAKYSQLYIPPYSVATMRSDLPHAGDSYLASIVRLSMEGDVWAKEVLQVISALMANDCGCPQSPGENVCSCDGSCDPLVLAVVVQKDLQRGHCYFKNKTAPVPLTNAIYTRGADADFGEKEDGGFIEAQLKLLKDSWV